jgi:hypothetical protein
MTQAQPKMLMLILLLCSTLLGQSQQNTSSASAVVPTLVNFSGTLTNVEGQPLTGIVGVTFLLYKDQQGGSPLWLETQNVTLNKIGHYTAVLGSTTSQGLPTDLFASGEARWLAVEAQGQPEQPRIMLLSVPYALKAGDAQTLGGLPPSAFILAPSSNSNPANSGGGNAVAASPDASSDVTTTGGTVNTLPLFTTATNIQNSAISQTGSGTTAKIGINTATPASALDVAGSATVRGTLTLPSIGTATSSAGKNSEPAIFTASVYNSSTKTSAAQKFQWQAEPAGNDTTTTSGTLNLLFGAGSAKPAETGLTIASNGLINFASGQTFPGAGTITGVNAGTALTGGGTAGAVTLNVDTTKIPQLSVANTFIGDQTIKGNLSDTGNITATGSISATKSITGQTANFTGSNTTQVVKVTQNGGGSALVATANQSGAAIAASGGLYGVSAESVSGFALYGGTTNGTAVVGDSNATEGYAIVGQALNSSAGASTMGVFGSSVAPFGVATTGQWLSASTVGQNTAQVGVWGDSSAGDGVHGTTDSGVGVYGQSTNFHGVAGFSSSPTAAGVAASNTNGGYGVYATTTAGGIAGYFQGNLQTTGIVTTYNNLPTYGNGVPSIVYEFTSFSGGSGGSNGLYTPPNDGVFRLILFQECTSTSSGGTIFAPSFSWTVPTGGGGFYGDIGGPDCSSLNSFSETFPMHVKGGTTIQWTYPGMNASFQNLILIEQLM